MSKHPSSIASPGTATANAWALTIPQTVSWTQLLSSHELPPSPEYVHIVRLGRNVLNYYTDGPYLPVRLVKTLAATAQGDWELCSEKDEHGRTVECIGFENAEDATLFRLALDGK